MFHVALPRKAPKIIAGRPCETLETVLVRLTSGGAVGWGEAAPGNAPTGNSEWAAGAFAVFRDWLAPAVVKTEIDSGKTLAERLAPFRGNQHAKAALDIAWWDLAARMQDRPLHELLGQTALTPGPSPGGREERMRGGLVSRGRAVPGSNGVARCVHGGDWRRLAAGFRRVKLNPSGLGPGNAPQRAAGVPRRNFHIDCEGALSLDHTEMLYRFDDFALEMVELPLAAEDLWPMPCSRNRCGRRSASTRALPRRCRRRWRWI